MCLTFPQLIPEPLGVDSEGPCLSSPHFYPLHVGKLLSLVDSLMTRGAAICVRRTS